MILNMLEINEPVNVWVKFSKNLIEPLYLLWRGRTIKVNKINLIHTTKAGSDLFYHFSLSSGGNFYRLGFDTKKLKWILEAVEEE